MKIVLTFMPEGLVQSLGWTLLHSLWQGLLILAITTLAIWLFKIEKAKKRYNLLVSALIVFAVTAAITFLQALDYSSSSTSAVFSGEISNTFVRIINIDHMDEISLIHMIESNFNWMVSLWFVGFSIFIIRLGGGHYYLQRIKRQAISNIPDSIQKTYEEVSSHFQIGQKVMLKLSGLIEVPMVIGVLRPIVLIPTFLVSQLSEDQLRAILTHELAHIKRWDHLFNLVQNVLEAIFFFNPFIWMLSSLIRREREHCCDDMALKVANDPILYVGLLAKMEEIRLTPSNFSLTFGKSKNELLRRIQRITGGERSSRVDFKGLIIVLVVFSFFTVTAFTYAKRQNKEVGVGVDSDISLSDRPIFNDKKLDQVGDVEMSTKDEYKSTDNSGLKHFRQELSFQDTTKQAKWKEELKKKIQEEFKSFYTKNKKEFDQIIDEMDISFNEEPNDSDHFQKMVALERAKLEMEYTREKMKLEIAREIEQSKLELHARAKRLELESELQRMKAFGKMKQSEKLAQEEALRQHMEELSQIEMLNAQEPELGQYQEQLQVRQMALEANKRELELEQRLAEAKQEAVDYKTENYGKFKKEFIDNLIQDRYINSVDEFKSLEIQKNKLYKINGQPIKKNHLAKYNKLFKKYMDEKGK